ncbi:asparaginase [Craterilacuibacter sp. RT1T]|uniref:asparaginase n=1 Tax=Craterilacuibacter sp. RT1T TaxID=2942211 RepID=UPI0020BF1532|nr:asparaginase [Craterilacuibacter sp. RT1T]MCL6263868.1 asparaginase [Craterilacuibacter sp. RT1T]
MSKRILVLYSGGTIGMDHTPAGLAPVSGLLPRLLERFRSEQLDFELIEYPQLIDSSAITLANWNSLIGDIASHYHACDGFVIIHGTDTMAYTASVLAFALQGLAKPVVITGSQLPLVHARSDGWGNLADAFEAACQEDLHEVVLAFDRVLLRGCRARKVDAASFAGFASPNAAPLAQFGIHIQWQRALWRQAQGNFHAQHLDEQVNILPLMLMPGAAAASFGALLQGAHHGAVLMSYGNGNAPAEAALLAGVASASARGLPVLNLTQVQKGSVEVGAYAASQPLAQAGALPGLDMTPEAALGKLTVLASMPLTAAQRRAYLQQDWAGEMTVPA